MRFVYICYIQIRQIPSNTYVPSAQLRYPYTIYVLRTTHLLRLVDLGALYWDGFMGLKLSYLTNPSEGRITKCS